MDPNLFHVDWDWMLEVITGIVLSRSFSNERSPSFSSIGFDLLSKARKIVPVLDASTLIASPPGACSVRVFVSKPSVLDAAQGRFDDALTALLRAHRLEPLTLQQHADPSVRPIDEVKRLMKTCRGAVILGLKQVHVRKGVFGTGTGCEVYLRDVRLPTPWNQIEAGMALMLDLPTLLLCEGSVTGGVFDQGATEGDIHRVELSAGPFDVSVLMDPFREWCHAVAAEEGLSLGARHV